MQVFILLPLLKPSVIFDFESSCALLPEFKVKVSSLYMSFPSNLQVSASFNVEKSAE